MPEIITIDCLDNGEVKIKVEGVKGKRCKELTAIFETNTDVLEEEFTHEYQQAVAAAVKPKLGVTRWVLYRRTR